VRGNGGADIINRINQEAMIIVILFVAFAIWWLFRKDDEKILVA
jgi:hypothetical protein